VQLSGVKWGSGPGKDVEVEAVPGGLILPEEGKIEEIRVELSLGPICFFKNQAVKTTPKAGKSLDKPGPHIGNYQTPGPARMSRL